MRGFKALRYLRTERGITRFTWKEWVCLNEFSLGTYAHTETGIKRVSFVEYKVR